MVTIKETLKSFGSDTLNQMNSVQAQIDSENNLRSEVYRGYKEIGNGILSAFSNGANAASESMPTTSVGRKEVYELLAKPIERIQNLDVNSGNPLSKAHKAILITTDTIASKSAEKVSVTLRLALTKVIALSTLIPGFGLLINAISPLLIGCADLTAIFAGGLTRLALGLMSIPYLAITTAIAIPAIVIYRVVLPIINSMKLNNHGQQLEEINAKLEAMNEARLADKAEFEAKEAKREYNTLSNKARRGMNTVKSSVSNAVKSSVNAASNNKGKVALGVATAAGIGAGIYFRNEIAEVVAPYASAAADYVANSRVGLAVASAATTAKDAVVSGATTAAEYTVAGATVAKDAVVSGATTAAEYTVAGATVAKDAMVSGATTVGTGVASGASYVSGSVSTGASSVANAVTNLFSSATAAA